MNNADDTRPEESPQIVVDGFLRRTARADVIDFSLYFLRFELRFTVTIPEEGTSKAPVYIKHRIQIQKPDITRKPR